jgi:hypothetical protein
MPGLELKSGRLNTDLHGKGGFTIGTSRSEDKYGAFRCSTTLRGGMTMEGEDRMVAETNSGKSFEGSF